eukprot:TRINITY_DN7040_c0_g5_i1.p1 TRINITY_DN7040_c0_g5~~TRINITY_DN7040_c0_g5_i1.p1  ORF type:complete len:777 (-),score=150.66 TRINITY_DN7040_c0_g5_i1:36-2096(-)
MMVPMAVGILHRVQEGERLSRGRDEEEGEEEEEEEEGMEEVGEEKEHKEKDEENNRWGKTGRVQEEEERAREGEGERARHGEQFSSNEAPLKQAPVKQSARLGSNTQYGQYIRPKEQEEHEEDKEGNPGRLEEGKRRGGREQSRQEDGRAKGSGVRREYIMVDMDGEDPLSTSPTWVDPERIRRWDVQEADLEGRRQDEEQSNLELTRVNVNRQQGMVPEIQEEHMNDTRIPNLTAVNGEGRGNPKLLHGNGKMDARRPTSPPTVNLRSHSTDDSLTSLSHPPSPIASLPSKAEQLPRSRSRSSSDTRSFKRGSKRTPASKSTRYAVHLYSKAVVLAIAYSASIGGMATLIGTGPNLVLSGVWRHLFPDAPPITFFDWFTFGFPLAMLFLLILWACLCVWYCPGSDQTAVASALDMKIVMEEYRQLGPLSFAERVVLIDFMVLACLWMTRSIGEKGEGEYVGWSGLFHDRVDDGTVAIAAALLLFFIPSRRAVGEKILEWSMVGELPWPIVLLLGGGFALSAGVTSSGLAAWIGSHLHGLHFLPPLLLVPSVALLVVICTEFSSNAATATVFLPILAQVAISIGCHPLLLMLPATCACSFAFMLPIATPPNAIAYATGYLQMRDMVIPGMVLNVIGIGLLTLFVPSLGNFIWEFEEANEFQWSKFSNGTSPGTGGPAAVAMPPLHA